jgi:hypothetical protein
LIKRIATTLLIAACLFLIFAFWFEWFFLAWIGWGLIFGTMEWYALSRKYTGDTLSEQIWLGTRSKSLFWRWFWSAFVVILLSWLVAHFLFRI